LEAVYPGKYKPSEKIIDDIIQQFWFKDWHTSLISYQIGYETLHKYLSTKKPTVFNRYLFYKFYVKENFKNIPYKTLQNLALMFEHAHVNEVSVDKLPKLLEFLSNKQTSVGVKQLLDAMLFKRVTNNDGQSVYTWFHHTLPEFLVAEFILSKKDLIKKAEKFILLKNKEITALKHSWSGVLRFLLESDKGKEFAIWLLEIGEKHKDNIDETYSDLLLSIDPSILSTKYKNRIFELIYDQYLELQLWIPVYSRSLIGKFASKKHIKILRQSLKKRNQNLETLVYRGNAVATFESIYRNKPSLFSKKEIEYWKDKLVVFATTSESNGVLQRNSLSALEYLNDPSVIEKVKAARKSDDNLVRDAFIRLCYAVDPNSNETIDYLLDSIDSIYGRVGIYEVTDAKAIKYFLSSLQDHSKLRSFIDRESIFDDPTRRGDHILIENIDKVSDKAGVVKEIKKLIKTAFLDKNNYDVDRSNFIRELSLIAQNKDSNFIFEFIDFISVQKEQDHILYKAREILPHLLTTKNVIGIFNEAKKLNVNDVGFDLRNIVYRANRIEGEPHRAYKKAIKEKLVDKPPKQPQFFENQKKRTYKRFKEYLEPEKGQYFPEVFGYYVRSEKDLSSLISKSEKARLIKLAAENLKKIDPRKIRVSMEVKGSSSYKISTIAGYFGDVLRVIQKLRPNLLKEHRQKIIDFIPFAYSEDSSTILEIIKTVSDDELNNFVNPTMLNEDADIRYLIPSSYIYMMGEYKNRNKRLTSPKKVLLSFISDDYFSDTNRESALEKYGLFITPNSAADFAYLKSIFAGIDEKDGLERKTAEIANEHLIQIYKNYKAVSWRIDQIISRAEPFIDKPSLKARSVTPFQNELWSLTFASPLFSLKDEKYMSSFLRLLEHSMKLITNNEDEYWSYANYLWKIVISYVDGLKEKGSMEPYFFLQSWFEKNIKGEKSKWFRGQLRDLRAKYIDFISRSNL